MVHAVDEVSALELGDGALSARRCNGRVWRRAHALSAAERASAPRGSTRAARLYAQREWWISPRRERSIDSTDGIIAVSNNLKETLSKVPAVALGFWVIKIAATTLGETGGAISGILGCLSALGLLPLTLHHCGAGRDSRRNGGGVVQVSRGIAGSVVERS